MSERDLAERMEKLERDNRRLKRTGVGLFVVLVALTTVYATRPVPDVIKAHEFDVVDNKGRVAVKLFEHSPLGFELNAGIEMFDTHGRERARFISGPIGWSAIQFLDTHGLPEVSISGHELREGLSRAGQKDRLRPHIWLRDSYLELYSKALLKRVYMGIDPSGIEIADAIRCRACRFYRSTS